VLLYGCMSVSGHAATVNASLGVPDPFGTPRFTGARQKVRGAPAEGVRLYQKGSVIIDRQYDNLGRTAETSAKKEVDSSSGNLRNRADPSSPRR
jgi:hypothetical protein